MFWFLIFTTIHPPSAFSPSAPACALDMLSPFQLYFSYKLVFQKYEVWRLISNFFFFSPQFSIDFLFHMFFLYVFFCFYPSCYMFLYSSIPSLVVVVWLSLESVLLLF